MPKDILIKAKRVGQKLSSVPILYYCLFHSYVAVKRGLLLGSERLTSEQKALIKENRWKWSRFDSTKTTKDNGYVLVDALTHFPNPDLLTTTIVGKYLGHKKNLRTLFLLRNFYDRKVRKICASYCSNDFVYLNLKGIDIGIRLRSFLDARRIYKKTKTGEELLSLEYDGLLIGDLIYDTYLRETREGTISKVGPELFKFIYNAIMTKKYYDKIFQRYDIKAVVLGHTVYSVFGLLARVAAKNHAEVYMRQHNAPVYLRVRRYRDLREIRTFAGRPSKSLFEHVYKEHKAEAVKSAELYLQKRMNPASHDLDGVDVCNAYGSIKVLVNRSEIIEKLNLDASKPIAAIMSHALIDAVHSHNWLLFRDYLTWLRETLDFVKDCPLANWLVKTHPSTELYNCKQNEGDEIEKITQGLRNHTIRLLPNEINTKSLLEFADVVITARGTAGLEFSCFGIPCIIAGESPYSGYGFTIEPKTKEAYFKLLSNINEVKRLNEEQVNRAKVLAYIYFVLLGAETAFLSPNVPFLGEFNEEVVWKEIYETSKKADPLTDPFYRNFEKFLDSNATHLLSRPDLYH